MARFGRRVSPKDLVPQSGQVKIDYAERGLSDEEADARAWATVNKMPGAGSPPVTSRRQSTAKRKQFDGLINVRNK